MTIQPLGDTRREILSQLVASYDDVARTGGPCLMVCEASWGR